MAAGMVEHGQQSIVGMLDQVVNALNKAAIDDEHFLRGFAGLLKRLGKHWQSGQSRNSASVLRQPASRPENDGDDNLSPRGSFTESVIGRPLQVPAPYPSVSQPTTTPPPVITPPDPLLSFGQEDFDWNFDPTFQMPAADLEQDVLFQSIWGNTQDATASTTSNLYATLLGDTLGFENI